ncbi:hypothetical protein Fmac_026172 [Flemingia macrophylla]|uniref:Uncharacterized protein n=1 Tax=Flemingia macrophylla TaxID=520843 RepID=A0ABD1LE54_9FABA
MEESNHYGAQTCVQPTCESYPLSYEALMQYMTPQFNFQVFHCMDQPPICHI